MRRKEFIAVAGGALAGMLAASTGVSAFAATGARPSLTITPPPPGQAEDAAFLLAPEKEIQFTAAFKDPYAGDPAYECSRRGVLRWSCTEGALQAVEGDTAAWQGDRPGNDAVIRCEYEAAYRRSGRSTQTAAPIAVKLFATRRVIAAASSSLLRNGKLDGYNIGSYPVLPKPTPEKDGHLRQTVQYRDSYAMPAGFFKVTKENRDTLISRNFTLGDFAHDYPWQSLGLPQYIALDYGLVEKLEALLEMLRADGLARKKFKFIYAFRPPSYNQSSRLTDSEGTLKAPFSMHQYGKAADIIIDDDDDLVMDDLDGDGRSRLSDALILTKYADRLDMKYLEEKDLRLGGAGAYAYNDFHPRKQTPYVHVDVRGHAGADGRPIRWIIQEKPVEKAPEKRSSKPDAKPTAKPDAKPTAKPDARPDIKRLTKPAEKREAGGV
ncbi:MAG: hypothetical protein NTX50_14565 [Candidatus Sumerlaeota bacterium]|nr:hypothetical protein [Candidatus Sumerlaeota bacterium]